MRNEKLLNFWYWTGRVLPLSALALLLVALVFGLDSVVDYLVAIIAVIFATFAFLWWWWVLDTVKVLYSTLQSAQEKFVTVIKELNEIKSNLNGSDRKRNKQEKN